MQAETGWAEAEALWDFIYSLQHKRIHRALYQAAYVMLQLANREVLQLQWIIKVAPSMRVDDRNFTQMM